MLACYVHRTDTEAVILSPSTVRAGGYRLTFWDQIGPRGHTEYDDLTAAQAELAGRIGPWPAVPAFEIEARPSEYQLADVAPPWLGLTVITAGRVEQGPQ